MSGSNPVVPTTRGMPCWRQSGRAANVAAGVMILLFRPYRVGDLIEVGGRTGRVEALDLFATELATPDNVKVLAPNGKVFGDFITNFSAHKSRRVDVVFRIDPKRDLAAVLVGLNHPSDLAVAAAVASLAVFVVHVAGGAGRKGADVTLPGPGGAR